jgi:hypothetical protein
LPRAETDITIPARVDLDNAAVVAFVEDERSGNVVQVLRMPLVQCKP